MASKEFIETKAVHEQSPKSNEEECLLFSSLPFIPAETCLENAKTQFLSSSEWPDHFLAISHLRVINKFNKNEGNKLLLGFFPQISRALKSPMTSVARNALQLINESSLNMIDAPSNDLLIQICSLVLTKASSEVNDLRMDAFKTLNEFAAKWPNDSLFYALCSECFSPNSSQLSCEVAIRVLAKGVETLGQNMVSLDLMTLNNFFKTLGKSLETRWEPTQIVALNICLFLHRLFGAAYTNCIDTLFQMQGLSEREAKNCLAAIQNNGGLSETLCELGTVGHPPNGPTTSECRGQESQNNGLGGSSIEKEPNGEREWAKKESNSAIQVSWEDQFNMLDNMTYNQGLTEDVPIEGFDSW